jgi:hypothetical protein
MAFLSPFAQTYTHTSLITHYLHKPKAIGTTNLKNRSTLSFSALTSSPDSCRECCKNKYKFSHQHQVRKRENSLTSDMFLKMRLSHRLLSTKFSLLNSIHSIVILIITYAMCVVVYVSRAIFMWSLCWRFQWSCTHVMEECSVGFDLKLKLWCVHACVHPHISHFYNFLSLFTIFMISTFILFHLYFSFSRLTTTHQLWMTWNLFLGYLSLHYYDLHVKEKCYEKRRDDNVAKFNWGSENVNLMCYRHLMMSWHSTANYNQISY